MRWFDSDAANGEWWCTVEQYNVPGFEGAQHHFSPGWWQQLLKYCVDGGRLFFFAAFGVSLAAPRLVQGKEGCFGLHFAMLFSSQIPERSVSAISQAVLGVGTGS